MGRQKYQEKYQEIKGDLIELAKIGTFDIIAHGCNCFHTMGSGIARKIRENFPAAFDMDKKTSYGSSRKLGTYSNSNHLAEKIDVWVGRKGFCVLNLYTQYNYGVDKVHLDYDALRCCLAKVNLDFKGKTIGLPTIGCGLAGGDWDRVKKIIQEELKDMYVTVVLYDGE